MTVRISIPFTLPEVYQGLAEGHGRASVDERGLHLEYRIEDAVFGVLKSRVHEMNIPFEDIDDILFSDYWYRRRIVVHLRSMRSLANLPTSKSGRIDLKIARASRGRAREFFSYLSLQMSEERIRQLDRSDELLADNQ